jgi:uncharacterized protein YyaL (SSP411 family)
MPPNRLIKEKSPYLLQHAYNPVNWFPWGPEAFEQAKKENKPIFLSIGYSTCHWCHVMERESFQDQEAAQLINEAFIPIKVDREERPDIDGIYMNVCQLLTGSGGWPLTIIMTPDKKPFFAATYIPKTSRFGREGLLNLIPRISQMWNLRQEEIVEAAEQVIFSMKKLVTTSKGDMLNHETLDAAFQELLKRFDHENGGFGHIPKFPTSHNFFFLLRYWKRKKNGEALGMVEKTLQAMRLGGIFDHIGFGFHRYSTDERWQVPHFEKMLYDQALLALAYTETYQVTKNKQHQKSAQEILDYVLRDMRSPEGGFYSAEDADSEGKEGKFYLWSWEEIDRILENDEPELVSRVYNVEKAGNFLEQATGRKTGANILYLRKPPNEIAADLNISPDELIKRMDAIRAKLFAARQEKARPLKDDKILTDWNGLMIAAFSMAAQVFERSKDLKAAQDAADFILDRLCPQEGKLRHRYREGKAEIDGFVNDYAFLVWGLLELYEATFNTRYLEQALRLNHYLLSHFWDKKEGGLFFTSASSESLFLRQKEAYDGAIPSGNSVAMMNLLRLGRITANPDLEEKASLISRAFSKTVSSSPSAFTQMLVALDFALGPTYEVVITGKSEAKDTKNMIRDLRREFIPNKVVLFHPAEEESPTIYRLAPFIREQKRLEGKVTVYVCSNYACQQPADDSDHMLQSLGIRKKKQ